VYSRSGSDVWLISTSFDTDRLQIYDAKIGSGNLRYKNKYKLAMMRVCDVFCNTRDQHYISSISPDHVKMFYDIQAEPEEAVLVDRTYCLKCIKWREGMKVHTENHVFARRNKEDATLVSVYNIWINGVIKRDNVTGQLYASFPKLVGVWYIDLHTDVFNGFRVLNSANTKNNELKECDLDSIFVGHLNRQHRILISEFHDASLVDVIKSHYPSYRVTLHEVLCMDPKQNVVSVTMRCTIKSYDTAGEQVVVICDAQSYARKYYPLPLHYYPRGEHHYHILGEDYYIRITMGVDYRQGKNQMQHNWQCPMGKCKSDCQRHEIKPEIRIL